MKEAISFLLNFIGRRDCNAGGRHCDVEQLGARLAHTQEVAGSSPAVATGGLCLMKGHKSPESGTPGTG